MKIITTSILVLILCLSAQAQNKAIKDFYKTHRKGGESIGLLLPGWVVQAGVNIAAGDRESRRDLKPIRPFLRRLSSLRFLTVEGAEQLPTNAVANFVSDVQQHGFSTLARIKEEGARVDILIRTKERGPKKNRRSIVKNVLMVVQDEGQLSVFTANGRWSSRQVQQLLKHEDVRGMLASN